MYTYCLRIYVICVVLISTPIYSQSPQQLSSPDIELLIQQLIHQSQEQPFATCHMHGTIYEESWPSYQYSNHEINHHISTALKAFQDSPPSHLHATELIRDYVEAIPYNIRYASRASERREYTFVLDTEGEKYYWEMNLTHFNDLTDLKSDTVIPYYLTPEDEAYFSQNQPTPHTTTRFNPQWNYRRIFAWDGQEYTFYNTSEDQRINHAWRKARDIKPDSIPSPLQAGIIPWGQGFYSQARLEQSNITAQEVFKRGKHLLQLTIQDKTGSLSTVIDLQIKKSPKSTSQYALLSQKIYKHNELVTDIACAQHIWHADQWIPTSVVTTRSRSIYDVARTERTTLIYSLAQNTVSPPMFRPQLTNASVTYDAPGLIRPLTYQMSPFLDNESLLAEKLSIALQATSTFHAMSYQIPKQANCATLALDYCTRQLGHPIPKDQLQTIIGNNGQTRLSDMVQLIENQGLDCQAVQTDLQTLATLPKSEVILHLPDKDHFIVLADIDSYHVWCLDLMQDHFLYKVEKSAFENNEWSEGTALVLANTPTGLTNNDLSHTLSDAEQQKIVGGIGFTCTKLLQAYTMIHCQTPPPCNGTTIMYYRLFGCELAESGFCFSQYTPARRDSNCITDPYEPDNCISDGDWTTIYYLNACSY